VIHTAILTGIPKRSIHHQSTSIENHRCLHDRSLSRSIAIFRFAARDSTVGPITRLEFQRADGSYVEVELPRAASGCARSRDLSPAPRCT
jgi:hypothetical protein